MKLKHLAAAVALSAGMAFNANAQDHIAENDSRYLPEPDMSLCTSPVFMEAVTFQTLIDALEREAENAGQAYDIEAFTVGQDADPKDADQGYTFVRIETPTTTGYLMVNNAEHKACVIERDTYNDYKYDAIVRGMDKEQEGKRQSRTPRP